jgi:hypothetical protein
MLSNAKHLGQRESPFVSTEILRLRAQNDTHSARRGCAKGGDGR